jgi:AcrR family transcriptional regulator
MSSARPTPARARRTALAPQRRPGKERVAALLQAGAAVIAERGYEAATMAEIAARADAPIGSLYRFFPSKEALADALIQRYRDLIDTAFEKIDASRESSTTAAFADALLKSLTGFGRETLAAVVALLDARPDGSARRSEFHDAYLHQLVQVLKRRDPHLTTKKAEDMAVVLLQNMKAMKTLNAERDAGAIAELRTMTRLYLESKLGE